MISYADMHEDMEPDLSQDAFGEDVIDSLETYDFDVDDDEDWDYVDDENFVATSKKMTLMTLRSSCTRMTRRSLS